MWKKQWYIEFHFCPLEADEPQGYSPEAPQANCTSNFVCESLLDHKSGIGLSKVPDSINVSMWRNPHSSAYSMTTLSYFRLREASILRFQDQSSQLVQYAPQQQFASLWSATQRTNDSSAASPQAKWVRMKLWCRWRPWNVLILSYQKDHPSGLPSEHLDEDLIPIMQEKEVQSGTCPLMFKQNITLKIVFCP